MNRKRSRSAAWAMINWALVEDKIKKATTILPDHNSIEQAISNIENEFSEEELYAKEAEDLENLLIRRIVNYLHKERGKEIKRNKIR